MPHLRPPSDTEDIIRLRDLSPETQARVRAAIRPPVPVPEFPISQSSNEAHLDKPNHGVVTTSQVVETSQRSPSGDQPMQSQTLQIQENRALKGREDSPSFPLSSSSQPLRPSFPPVCAAPMPAPQISAPQSSTAPLVTMFTPTSNLPTVLLPSVQHPALGAPHPSPSGRSGPIVPSVLQKRKTKNTSTNARKKKRGAEGQVIEVKESAQGVDDQATDELATLIRELKSDLASFRVDLPTPFVVAAEGGAMGDPALAIRSLAQFFTDQMAFVRGGSLLLATRVSNLEAHFKTSRKVPKGERSDQENEVYKYMKSEIHRVVQEILHWKPSDGFGALPCEGDKYMDDDSGEEIDISAPQWDERIDTVKNVNWITSVTTLIEENIQADIEGNHELKETLQGIPISKHIEETLKGYIRHLKTNWVKARMDPGRMKRERRRGRRNARQREESLRMVRMLDGLNVIVARSANRLGVTESITIKEHHLPPDIFSEEESGPEDDTPDAVRAFAEYGGPLQVGEFYLTHPKPYLSPAAISLKSLARLIYKSHHVRPTNSKKRIEGPASNILPPDMKLENWMVDAEWVPEGRAVALTFLNDSVPSDQIGAVMNDALHTWNKGAQTLAIRYESSKARSGGSTDRGEGGSGLNLVDMVEDSTNESEEE